MLNRMIVTGMVVRVIVVMAVVMSMRMVVIMIMRVVVIIVGMMLFNDRLMVVVAVSFPEKVKVDMASGTFKPLAEHPEPDYQNQQC